MEKEEGLFELGRGTEFIYLLSNHRLSKNLRDSLPPDDSYRERERGQIIFGWQIMLALGKNMKNETKNYLP